MSDNGSDDNAIETTRLPEVRRTAPSVRWIARASGLVVCAYFLGILVVLPIVSPEDNVSGTGPIGCAAVLACLPLLLAWRWPRIGGVLAIAGSVLMCAAVFLYGARPVGGPVEVALVVLLFGLPFAIAGALFMMAARDGGLPTTATSLH